MDRVKIDAARPLQIRSGHTPVNLGLMGGALVAAVPAMLTQATHSRAVDAVLPDWAAYVFYAMLLFGAGMSISATWHQLPGELTRETYRIIVGRLVRERLGHYAVASILICFSIAALSSQGLNGLSGASFIGGPAVGLVLRARQTHVDVNKLHRAVESGAAMTGEWAAELDDGT